MLGRLELLVVSVVPMSQKPNWNLLYKFTCSVCLSDDNSAQTRPFLWQNPQVVERHTLAEPAFSMAEPAGGVCPSVEVLKPRSQLSVCRGPETQIPTNILIHLSANFLFWGPIGTYSEKMAISSSFFGPENVVTLSLFFPQKSFV